MTPSTPQPKTPDKAIVASILSPPQKRLKREYTAPTPEAITTPTRTMGKKQRAKRAKRAQNVAGEGPPTDNSTSPLKSNTKKTQPTATLGPLKDKMLHALQEGDKASVDESLPLRFSHQGLTG